VSSCLANHWFSSFRQDESPSKNWLKSEYAKYIPSSAFQSSKTHQKKDEISQQSMANKNTNKKKNSIEQLQVKEILPSPEW
jgi:hypothetical protein